jgi:hypothetical protein
MGLFNLIKNCFCSEDTTPSNPRWKKSTLMLLVNHYELDYEIKDRDGNVLDECAIEDYDEKKHNLSFAGEHYYNRVLSRV